MRFSISAVPWLLLLAGIGSGRAQLRGESSLRFVPEGTLLNETVVVLSDQDEVDEQLLEHLDIVHDIGVNVSESRRLFGSHNMFEQLQCNLVRCNAGSTTWKQANFQPANGKVTIPCGMCVTMDYDASQVLELPHGLNIEGTLRFANGYKITIKTPFIHVQGNLEMASLKKVTDTPDIKIILTGTDELITSFVPAANNKFRCSPLGATNPSPCNVGRKPFIVAGGKVTIRGVPDQCPTWTHLHDIVARAELPSPTEFTKLPALDIFHRNPVCRSQVPYVQETFSTRVNVHGWTGGYGALFNITSAGTFVVSSRKNETEHGPTFDLKRFQDCLVPDQQYLFRARIKLTKAGVASGTLTTCAMTDSNCLTLQSTVRTPTALIGRKKGYETKDNTRRYGIWQDFYASVVYTADELSPENIYQILRLHGPEPDVVIEMDDALVSLPSPASVPDPSDVCGGNLVLNGDAELDDFHPYPIGNAGGVLMVEQESSGNNFFRHFARRSDMDSIIYVMDAPGCLIANGRYKVSARIRAQSSSPVSTAIELRSTFAGGSVVQRVIAECPGSTRSTWTMCEAPFTLLPELTGDGLQEIRLQFETFGAPNVAMDIDDIVLIWEEGSVSSIVVPNVGISSCWSQGAEILITSHTLNYDDGQVRRIVSAPTPYGDGFVKLELNSTIVPPTTLKESEDFAVEVALLSRNIVFEGNKDDPDTLLGAHFMVMLTNAVDQLIEGVEFRNFGQSGVLGRYPIHFHLCDNVDGSIVSKNMIRESNQRCIVVHGTHNATVVDNVAYDTRGHCFMTEDGGETDNVFRGNLGALTQPATRLVRLVESDNLPSTFWCSNPQNEWIGNVAAGSQHNGFWFELQLAVRSPTLEMPLSHGMVPRFLNLKQFRDNVAHSNFMHGLRTYPEGFFPPEEAVFYNTRSFRNKQEGIFVHNSRNLAFSGGVLADNRIQFDFDRGAENIHLSQFRVIGVTDLYKEILRTQPSAPAHDDIVVGLELHGHTINMGEGATIRDIVFSGFVDTLANHSAVIEIDDKKTHGLFDYWSTLQGIKITEDVTPAQFDFGDATANGIDTIYLTDLDSGMRPRGSTATGVSTVLSNSPVMTHFIDLSKCEKFAERAYLYCSNTCLRTASLAVPSATSDDIVLRVQKAGDANNFIEVGGNFHYETVNLDGTGGLDEVANTSIEKNRYYAIALPSGSMYVLSFIDKANGSNALSWPANAEFTMQKAQCDTSLDAQSISLVVPPASETECRELIRNGNLEMSSTNYPYWQHHETKLQLAKGLGISGSNALSESGQNAPATGLVGQYLDVRCLQRGQQYEVKAWVKLTRNGAPYSCDSVSTCPRARLKIRTPTTEDGQEFDELNIDVVHYFERPYRQGDWNLLQGTFTVDARIEAGSSVLFFIERGRISIKMFLDNVSVALVPKQCADLVFNGQFSDGKSSFWYTSVASVAMEMSSNALKMTRRSALLHSPEQDIRTGCMTSGDRFVATARVRLLNTDGSLFTCDPTLISGESVCPRMKLRSFVDVGLDSFNVTSPDGGSIAITDHGTANGWYMLSGVFIATEDDAVADRSILSFDQVSSSKDFVIDDVSIKPLTQNCDQLFLNGDGSSSGTPSFWSHFTANGGERIDIVSFSGNNAFKIHNRNNTGDGIHQFVDPRCLAEGTRWKVVARMNLVSKSTGLGVTCDPLDNRLLFGCPSIRIAGWKSGTKQADQVYFMSNRPTWSASAFNRYEVEFTVDNALASWDRVSVGIRGYNSDWDLYVDDLSLRPVL